MYVWREGTSVVCVCLLLRLKSPPETLTDLSDSLLLVERLQGEMETTENEFEPLQYVYNYM